MGQRRSWRRYMGWGALVAAPGSTSAWVEASLAASGWLPPADISATGAANSRVQVAVDGQGNAVAIWRRGADGGEVTVQSAVRPAGGPWQAAVDVSRPGRDGSAPARAPVPGPQLALDAQGNAVAVWQRYNGTSLVIQAAERPAGGRWSAPVDISVAGAAGEDAGSPRVAIDRQGNAVAIWHRTDLVPRRNRVQSAVRPVGGTWQPPVAVSAPDVNATSPQVAFDAQGEAIAIWNRTPHDFDPAVQSAVRSPEGIWQAPADIPGSFAIAELHPGLAVDSAGNAIVVWTGLGAPAPFVLAATRPASGAWQTPVKLVPGGYAPSVALDGAGSATAVWAGSEGVVAATRPVGGDWQPGVSIGPTVDTDIPNVVLDERGDAIAAWSNAGHPDAMVRRRIASEWQETIRVSAVGRSSSSPELAVDPNGNAVAAWSDPTAGVISAAGFDATAPELRAVAVPGSAAAGRAVSFSASPFDVWSAPSPASWTFGDGATAVGNAVTHSYADVGLRTVSVTTTDLLGNAAAATRPILIGPSVLGLRVSPYAFTTSRPGRVSLRLPSASSVRFLVERAQSGRRVGGRCVAPRASTRRRAACTRYVRTGSFTRSRPSGTHGFELPTRFAGRRLRQGRYRLSATPRAGGLRGAPSRSGFQVTG